MDTVLICKVSIAPKRRIPQLVKRLFVCSHDESVEDCSHFFVPPAVDVHTDGIAQFRCSRGVEPVRSREFYDAACQVSVSYFAMLLGWHLVLHRRVADFGDGQFAAETRLIERHGFGASALKQQEWCEMYHQLLLSQLATRGFGAAIV